MPEKGFSDLVIMMNLLAVEEPGISIRSWWRPKKEGYIYQRTTSDVC